MAMGKPINAPILITEVQGRMDGLFVEEHPDLQTHSFDLVTLVDYVGLYPEVHKGNVLMGVDALLKRYCQLLWSDFRRKEERILSLSGYLNFL